MADKLVIQIMFGEGIKFIEGDEEDTLIVPSSGAASRCSLAAIERLLYDEVTIEQGTRYPAWMMN